MLCNPISILVVGIPPMCEPNSCAREQWIWRGMTDVFHYNNVTRALWRLQSPFNFLFALTTKKTAKLHIIGPPRGEFVSMSWRHGLPCPDVNEWNVVLFCVCIRVDGVFHVCFSRQLGPLVLTWINFNPSMDKYTYIHNNVCDWIIYPFPNFNGCRLRIGK